VKWAFKLGRFAGRQADSFGDFVLHEFFHDGKGPACVNDCTQLSIAVGGAGVAGVMLVCAAATRGAAVSPCFNGVSQIAAWAGAGVAGSSLQTSVSTKCVADVCTVK
jgi:hypothetical protein